MSDNTYMEQDPKSLEEARTMLLESWQDIDKGKQAEKRRDELIVQAFDLGASYTEVMACTGLSRPTVYRIRKRAEHEAPSEEAAWDFTIPGHYSKTNVPQSILEDTLQDGLIGLLDDVTDDDSQLGKDFSSPDLTDEQKAIRDAIHDLAARAAVSKTNIVASTALGITLTRHQPKTELVMDKASKKTRAVFERLRLVDKKEQYIPACPYRLAFTYPSNEMVKSGHGYALGVFRSEGFLLYDTVHDGYLGFFPGNPKENLSTCMRPCTNGSQYDFTSDESHDDAITVESGPGTCTIIGYAEKR